MPRLVLAVFFGMAFSIFSAVPVFGQSAEVAPEEEARQQIDALQAQAQSLKKEIDGFNHDLEIVVEKHNETRVELDKLTHDLADSRARLDAMLTEQYAQEKLLTDRLKALYKAGDINFLNILLNVFHVLLNAFDIFGNLLYIFPDFVKLDSISVYCQLYENSQINSLKRQGCSENKEHFFETHAEKNK